MTEEELQRRVLEINLARATLVRDQTWRHYERLRNAYDRARGSVAEEEMDAAETDLALRELDVQECKIRLGA